MFGSLSRFRVESLSQCALLRVPRAWRPSAWYTLFHCEERKHLQNMRRRLLTVEPPGKQWVSAAWKDWPPLCQTTDDTVTSVIMEWNVLSNMKCHWHLHPEWRSSTIRFSLFQAPGSRVKLTDAFMRREQCFFFFVPLPPFCSVQLTNPLCSHDKVNMFILWFAPVTTSVSSYMWKKPVQWCAVVGK